MPIFAFGQLTDTTRVALHDLGDQFEMENGHLGVRIPKSSLFNPNAPNYVPAPIRAVVYKDGSLSSQYQNYLSSTTPALTMDHAILYQTDDSCAIKISYTFLKPPLTTGAGQLEAGGPGYYHITFRMKTGEKVCAVTEESDYEVSYDLKVSDGLNPDKARYIGHNSTSIANGYDIFNNIYVKNDLTGYHATVDLVFNQRKDYPLTARWNPFVVNSGWHWQLYDSAAPGTANTFGIFDGRSSQLLGAEASGVGVFTAPASLNDLHAAHDANGNCHIAWRTEQEIWYKKVDSTGAWTAEILVATGLVSPFIYTFGSTVNILAINPLADPGEEIVLLKKIGSGSFQAHTILTDATLEDPYVYGASDGVHDFILFDGERNMLGGFQLYSADFNTTNYTYADRLANGSATRASNRPDMKRTPQGVLVVFTEGVSYQSYNFIANGTTTFAAVPFLPFGTQAVTFGMNVDLRTGDFFWVNNFGDLRYVDMDGPTVVNTYSTPVGAYVEHGAFGLPNRRAIATDPGGDALAYHEGFYYFFDNGAKTWAWLFNATWDALKPASIYFNPNDSKFYIVGKYQGKLARFSYEEGGNPTLIESFPSTEQKTAGIKSIHKRVAPTGNYYPDIRFEWCIYAGKKSTDLPAADVVQPIAKAMNRVSGLASKLDDYENEPLIFDPSFENGSLYMPSADLQAIIQKVKNDPTFYNQMVVIDPLFKDVLDAWQDPTNAKTNELYNKIISYSNNLKDALTNGDGIYSFYYLYNTAANLMRRYGDQMAALMADTKLTPAQRNNLKKTAGLFARILWDDDFVPLFVEHGLSLGNPNQVQAYTGQRWFFALILNEDPEFNARAAEVPIKLEQILAAQVNSYGAARGTPHYLQPPMDLVALTGLQMRNAGITDIFQGDPSLTFFSDFILHLLTPPSVRFSNGTKRKLVVFGDGSEESAAIFGLMATGFAGQDPFLSKRLMRAYRNGPPRSSAYGFVTMAINHNLPDTSLLNIGSAHFPGYFSGFRAGVGTDKETSTWFINGEWYDDHRNDDKGTLGIYALGAPLSLNYSSFFQPSVTGAHMKSTPVLLSEFPEWNNTAWQPFQMPNNFSWYTSQHDAFIAFKNSAYSKATFTRSESWTRQVFQFQQNEQLPVIIVKDGFSNTATDYVYNFNFAASGPVQTPNGPVTPPSALWNWNGGPTQTPSASPVITLAPGMRRFDFTGTAWPAHPAGGINWEVYLPSGVSNDATLTTWAHTFTPSVEFDEFLATNGSSFVERQTMLRVKGQEGFLTIIVPYFKGQRPTGLNVSQAGDTIFVNAADFDFETDLTYATFQGGGKTILTTFDDQQLQYANASIEDGPMELEIRTDTIVARLHGESGARKVKLPSGGWTLRHLSADASYNGTTGEWTLNHSFVDSLQNSFSGAYTAFVFVKSIKVSPKVFLQGPYNTGNSLMSDNLRSGGFLPEEEPYTGLNFQQHNSGGGETTWAAVFATTGNDAIVDWVFVELRDKNAPSTVLATRAALVQRDGDVVDVDGTSPVDFHGLAADDYYVAVRHRNHLGCRTASVVNLGNTASVVDFTSSLSIAYKPSGHPNEVMASLGGGKFGLWGGNANGDNYIRYSDIFIPPSTFIPSDALSIFNHLGGNSSGQLLGYNKFDINLDKYVRYSDIFIPPSIFIPSDALIIFNILGGIPSAQIIQGM
jgi:hypothetical protein